MNSRLELNHPIIITPRLLPGVEINDGESVSWISIEYSGDYTSDNRIIYNYYLDIGNRCYDGNDLYSGCGGGNLQSGLSSLLSFLSAAAESYQHFRWNGENAELFPKWIVRWADKHSDEIGMLAYELEENDNLILENARIY